MKHLFYGILLAIVTFYFLSLAKAEPVGALNPNVTQATIGQTICVAGWTSTVRPPVSYTNKLKRAEIGKNAVANDFEEDHFIAIELGGSPTNPLNLWAEPWSGHCNAHNKDRVENSLKRQVCTGVITLADAQLAIRDWRTVYKSTYRKAC